MGIAIREEPQQVKPGAGRRGAGEKHHRLLVDSGGAAGALVVETANGQCALPTAAAQIASRRGGVLEYSAYRSPNTDGLEWAENDEVPYLKKGPIGVLTETVAVDGGQVYVRFAAGAGGTQLGVFRNDSDGGTAAALSLTNTITSVNDATGADVVLILDDETFDVGDDGTAATAIAVAALIAAEVDASAAFTVTDNLDGTLDIVRVDGSVPVATALPSGVTAAEASAALLPGAHFVGNYNAGAAVIDYRLD